MREREGTALCFHMEATTNKQNLRNINPTTKFSNAMFGNHDFIWKF